MRLLLDENLSPRLIPRLRSRFVDLIHVRDIGLKQANDKKIWLWAKENRYSVLTTDSDVVALSLEFGWPPKVIHIEECDFPLLVIEELLRRNAVRISEFERDSKTGLLTLRQRQSPGT